MNLAALFSGGKDSIFAIHRVQEMGHSIGCLVTILTSSPDSHLLHHPNISWTKLQAQAMNLPQIFLQSNSDDTEHELELLKHGLKKAKKEYGIEGIVHGGILSRFQKSKFETLSQDLNLKIISPIWKENEEKYMSELITTNFEFILSSVSCDGLDETWLGKKITKNNLESLVQKSKKHKFNLSFEGGEAETFVTNCPLFSNPIEITRYEKFWDGYRGRFEITEAVLKNNVR
ncbi:MAG TPA: diphthine--ammonia ligase [Candidatus Nitrosotenuis sp.]|nr:diphthine--ammonia ligase [Candidatus Nitrosotenuis sp.]HIH46317.1 diphthine--ammonia ligase [Candidatus Nitrosotenuis sp.]